MTALQVMHSYTRSIGYTVLLITQVTVFKLNTVVQCRGYRYMSGLVAIGVPALQDTSTTLDPGTGPQRLPTTSTLLLIFFLGLVVIIRFSIY